MKRFIIGYVAAAFALAAVATMNAVPAFAQVPSVGERIGNARPNHYDSTGKQFYGWTAEEIVPPKALGPRQLYLSTRTPLSPNARNRR